MKNLKLMLLILLILGKASWYDTKSACGPKTNSFIGCPTKDGSSLYELEKRGAYFVASNQFDLGKRVKITEVISRKSVIATVRDRGGFKKYGRIADLGRTAFQALSPLEKGVIDVEIEAL